MLILIKLRIIVFRFYIIEYLLLIITIRLPILCTVESFLNKLKLFNYK